MTMAVEIAKPAKDFSIYIPFLDYVIDKTNYILKEKIKQIRKWIVDKIHFTKEFIEKMELSIIITYKEVRHTKGFPEDLHSVFHKDESDDDDVEEVPIPSKPSLTKKTLQSSVVEVVVLTSDDDDDVQLVSSLQNPTEKLPAPINRILQTVPIVVDDEIDEHRPSTTPLLSDFSTEQPSTPPTTSQKRLEDDNKLLYYRRSDLLTLESDIRNISTPKSDTDSILAKKKHKKAKKRQKKHLHKEKPTEKEKHKRPLECVQENVAELPSNRMCSTEDEPKRKTTKEIDTESNEKLSLEQKSISELLHIQQELLQDITHDHGRPNALATISVQRPSIPCGFEQLISNNGNVQIVESVTQLHQNQTILQPTVVPMPGSGSLISNLAAPPLPMGLVIPSTSVIQQNLVPTTVHRNLPQTPLMPITSFYQQNLAYPPVHSSLTHTPLITSISTLQQNIAVNSNLPLTTMPCQSVQSLIPQEVQTIQGSKHVTNCILTHPANLLSNSNLQPQSGNNQHLCNVQASDISLFSKSSSGQLPLPPSNLPPLQVTPNTANIPVKDPRLRKFFNQGNYCCNTNPPQLRGPLLQQNQIGQPMRACQVPTTVHFPMTTKAKCTYGDHKKKRLENEEKQRQEEIRKRQILEEEIKRKEKESIHQTESIREILKTQNCATASSGILSEKSVVKNLEQFVELDKSSECTAPKKLTKRRNSAPNSRLLKQLETTLLDSNSKQDFIPSTLGGKRRASISARRAIAEISENENISDTRLLNFSPIEEVKSKRAKINESSPLKEVLKIKPCEVRLIRLTESEIQRLTARRKNVLPIDAADNSNKQPTVVSKKSTKNRSLDCYGMSKSAKQPHLIRNEDCRMTEKNCNTCVLCNKMNKNLTHHYVHTHKTESYVSRLLWEELDDLQIRVPFAEQVISSTGEQEFKVKCPFCPADQSSITGKFTNLRLHYSKHTGEYSFSCGGCGLQKATRGEIRSHQFKKRCNGSAIRTLYKYLPEEMAITMYLCSHCNFVQLNEANVFKHLREQHGVINHNVNHVKQLTLAAIKDGTAIRASIATLPEIIETPPALEDIQVGNEATEILQNVDRVIVRNEPLVDENLDSIIKTEPEFVQDFDDGGLIKKILKSSDENKFVWMANPINPDDSKSQKNECNTIDLKPDIAGLECLLQSNDNGTALNNEANIIKHEESEMPANKPDPELLLFESAKALLRKYSSSSGIQPDWLYRCPEVDCVAYFSGFALWLKHVKTCHKRIVAKCPHCCFKTALGQKEPTELPVEEFEQHFQDHGMKLYFCFYCDESFSEETKLYQHASEVHAEVSQLRMERIPSDITCVFCIIIGESFLTDRLEFLQKLNEVFCDRVQRKEAMADDPSNLSTTWHVAENATWLHELQLPAFIRKVTRLICPIRSCNNQRFSNEDEHLHHLSLHNLNTSLMCPHCYLKPKTADGKSVMEHYFLHSTDIFICGVCSYHTPFRQHLCRHISEMHDQRDVPLMRLHRSDKTQMELSFAFAAGMRTYTTTETCFCGCGTTNLKADTFVSHLHREHRIRLLYFCHYCDNQLIHLSACEDHHAANHSQSGKQFKIRCQIALIKGRKIHIESIGPLKIRLIDDDCDHNLQQLPTKSCTDVPIKKEIVEDDNDDIIFMEEDEIVAEEEAKKLTKNDSIENVSIIKYLKINKNLFNNHA